MLAKIEVTVGVLHYIQNFVQSMSICISIHIYIFWGTQICNKNSIESKGLTNIFVLKLSPHSKRAPSAQKVVKIDITSAWHGVISFSTGYSIANATKRRCVAQKVLCKRYRWGYLQAHCCLTFILLQWRCCKMKFWWSHLKKDIGFSLKIS